MLLNRDGSPPEFSEYKSRHDDATHSSDTRPFDANQIPLLTAIEIISGYKWIGRVCARRQILAGFHMRVPENRLYCLIGPKRCGKSTVLQIITGLQSLDKGIVEYRGRCISILDPRIIGFMPQQDGLHPRLTLRETLYFHGKVLDMNKDYLLDRVYIVSHLVNLPDDNLKVSEMTHQERCRTSFALAILHEPDYLLLDEPTTGADAVLRHEFRLILRRLLMNRRTSIIMASHDFDESVFCDVVGLMRDGRMIAEGPPDIITEALGARSLIGVFYITAVSRGRTDYRRMIHEIGSGAHMGFNRSTFSKLVPTRHIQPRCTVISRIFKVALLLFTRQIIRTLALLLLPALYICLFGLSIGPLPSTLTLGFMEEKKFENYRDQLDPSKESFTNMILEDLSKSFKGMAEVESVDEGIESVLSDATDAFLWFPGRANLSAPHLRVYYRRFRTRNVSDLELYVDPTNYILQDVVKDVVVKSFRKISNEYFAQDADRPKEPLVIEAFTERNGQQSGLLVWGAVAGTTLALGAMLSVSAFDFCGRVRAEGVSSCETHMAHLCVRLVILSLQNVLLLIAAALTAGLEASGETALALVRCWVILEGSTFCGIALGVMMSTWFGRELPALRAVIYIMCLLFLISGVFWPVESVICPLNQIGSLFPIQHTTASFKYLIFRDMTLAKFLPWFGFLVSSIWGLLLYLLSYITGRLCMW